jgi:3',5'-nucleoside bisphosphate phosphatase
MSIGGGGRRADPAASFSGPSQVRDHAFPQHPLGFATLDLEVRTKVRPLLCELHAHTTWSDGELALHELVDLYGRSGFDVLTVTDHVLRTDAAAGGGAPPAGVHEANHAAYLAAVRSEAARARRSYDMVVIPGVELTYDDPEPARAAHALAIGCPEFVALDRGLETALARASDLGAAIVAAHPEAPDDRPRRLRRTQRFWREWDLLGGLLDRYELFNGRDLFSWVADAGLPAVAGGDFHRPQHIGGWKTLVPCEKREDDLVAYLRSTRPVYLALVEPGLTPPLRRRRDRPEKVTAAAS